MPADLQIAGSRTSSASAEGLYEPLVPGKLARESVEVLDQIHRCFLQTAEPALSELMQSPVKMISRETEQSTFANSLKTSSVGDRIIALELFPGSDLGFLCFSSPLVFRVLDRLLATPGDPKDNSGRIATAIELHVLRELFDLITRILADTWKQSYPVSFRQIPTSDDELEQRVAAVGNDPAVILNASVELNGASGELRLILPTCLARMAALKLKSASTGRPDPRAIDGGIFDRLGDARLEVDVILQAAGIRIRDLLNLAPGRILMLGKTIDAPFDCLVNGTRQFTGDLMPEDGRYGIQIKSPSPELPGS